MSDTLPQEIVDSIALGIRDAQTEVTLDGNRALIEVRSATFSGMSRVAKQQAVYACIESYIADGRLHAVTIRALEPS